MTTITQAKRPRLRLPDDIFYGWWVLAAGSVIMGLSSGVVSYAATVFFIPVSTALSLSHAATSIATSVARMENSLFAFFVGYAIDRFGPRPAIALGMTLMGAGLICFGLFAQSLLSFVVTWSFMVALGGSIGGFPPVWAALNNWFVRRKGRAMGIGMAAQSLGGLLIAPALAVMITVWGWRTAAIVSGVVLLVITLPLSRVMRARPSDMGLRPDGDPEPTPSSSPLERGRTQEVSLPVNFTLRQALKTPTIWVFNLCFGARQMVQGGISLHISPLLQAEGYSGVQAGSLVGLLALMGIVGAMAIGYLADKFERRKVAGLVVGVEAASLLALFLGGGGWTVYLFLAGFGFAIGVHTMNRVILGDYYGQSHYARLWGLLGVGTLPLGIVGPLLAGWLFDTTGSYRPVVLIFALVSAAAALGYYNLRRPRAPAGGSSGAAHTNARL